MKPNTQAVSGVSNHGRQHGKPAPLPAQPAPPPAQAEPRAARPADVRRGNGAAGRTLFTLRPTERSFGEEIRPLPAGISGTEEALAAARAGDEKRADELEVAWLNAWGPKPVPPEDVPAQLLAENGWRLYALEILHGGPTLIEWGYRTPCPRCGRRIKPDVNCRRCHGEGFLHHNSGDDTIWIFRTDTELRAVGEVDDFDAGLRPDGGVASMTRDDL